MTTKVYIVRHCQASGNLNRVFQGTTDADITETGAKQLDMLSLRFRNIRLDAVYCSPLIRAQKTAQAITRFSQLPIITVPELREIDGGHWEGQKWHDFPTLYPEEANNWVLAPHKFCADGGESMPEVYARMKKTVLCLASENEGRTIAVVSHGCAIRNLLCFAHGWKIDRLNDVEWSDNTGVSLVEFEQGVPKIIFENDNSHLNDELSTFSRQTLWKRRQTNADVRKCFD